MNDLDKMNLIAIVQQLPKDDIDFIQTYISIMEEKMAKLKRENNLLKADIEASQEIISDYKEEYENENERLNFNYKEALDEIDRLNNIINELEKELNQEYLIWQCNNRSYGKTIKYGINIAREHYFKRLQELKENKQ